MSDQGATYAEILGHYYGGLVPRVADLPATVRIGLAEDQLALSVDASGPFEVRANGLLIGVVPGGLWTFRRNGGGVSVVPPGNLTSPIASILFDREWPR